MCTARTVGVLYVNFKCVFERSNSYRCTKRWAPRCVRVPCAIMYLCRRRECASHLVRMENMAAIGFAHRHWHHYDDVVPTALLCGATDRWFVSPVLNVRRRDDNNTKTSNFDETFYSFGLLRVFTSAVIWMDGSWSEANTSIEHMFDVFLMCLRGVCVTDAGKTGILFSKWFRWTINRCKAWNETTRHSSQFEFTKLYFIRFLIFDIYINGFLRLF